MSSVDRRFEVLQVLGRGAYAAVCAARDSSGERVALKVFPPEVAENPAFLARARDETRRLVDLRHPNVVRNRRLLLIGGHPVMVMDLVDGASVRELIRAHPAGLPPPVALAIVGGVALALDAARNDRCGIDGQPMGLVHRDVKPANVLVSRKGEVKLTDFGIAQAAFERSRTRPSDASLGSRGYSAPEQADNTGADSPAVDIYALGLVLFEMLGGRPMVLPRGEGDHATRLAASLQHLGVTDDIETLIRRMCAHASQDRPSAMWVADQVDARLTGKADPLREFASTNVVPLADAAAAVPAAEHSEWPAVSFLTADDPTSELERGALRFLLDTRRLDRQLRETLARPDWERHLPALRELTRGRDDWSVAPVVAHLERALLPRWNLWAPRPTPEQVAALLELVEGRQGDAVIERARRLG